MIVDIFGNELKAGDWISVSHVPFKDKLIIGYVLESDSGGEAKIVGNEKGVRDASLRFVVDMRINMPYRLPIAQDAIKIVTPGDKAKVDEVISRVMSNLPKWQKPTT